MRGSTNVKKYP